MIMPRQHEVSATELRVLVLAPIGRDAELTCEVLRAAGVGCQPCGSLQELGRELVAGAGAILATAEALEPNGAPTFERMLELQEPWSDIPIVLATASGDTRAREASIGRLERAGAVTVLERPIRLMTLRSVIGAALRVRRRQYEMRSLLEELQVNVARLDAERVVRERFVSLLAHDLRGPLSAATLAAKMLVTRPDKLVDRRDLALRIERNLRRIDQMVRDLLDANRLRAGYRLPLDLQPCDLVEIAADVVADLEEPERDRVRTSAPERLEGVWSPNELHRALWNLITNAFKYGTENAPVDVLIHRAADGVVVSVHNQGPGIAPDEQLQIFEPFGRARGAEARGRGWGLGLTLVRGCVEAHGGKLELSSTDDAGTTFTLRLPLDARPFQAPAPAH
jgi:signal transduction histidine kinase